MIICLTILKLLIMEYTKFNEIVIRESSSYGYEVPEIITLTNLSFFSQGYEIVLDATQHIVILGFLNNLSKFLNTPYVNVFALNDVVSIIVYFK